MTRLVTKLFCPRCGLTVGNTVEVCPRCEYSRRDAKCTTNIFNNIFFRREGETLYALDSRITNIQEAKYKQWQESERIQKEVNKNGRF